MVFVVVAAASFLALGSCARQKQPENTLSCVIPSCEVSFWQILANPERFHNNEVGVIGYLAISHRLLVLFPTEQQYILHDWRSSIGFHVPASQQMAFVKANLYKYVKIRGVIDGHSDGGDGTRLAEFSQVTSLHEIEFLKPSDRETEFGVSVDMLGK